LYVRPIENIVEVKALLAVMVNDETGPDLDPWAEPRTDDARRECFTGGPFLSMMWYRRRGMELADYTCHVRQHVVAEESMHCQFPAWASNLSRACAL
jgi:hypothetical protein